MDYSSVGMILIALASFGVMGAILLLLKIGAFDKKSDDETIEH